MVLSPGTDLSLVIITATIAIIILAMGSVLCVIAYHKRLLKQQDEHKRSLIDAILQAQEEERQRIAEDLHDDMGALLSLVKLRLSHISTKSREDEIIKDVKEICLLLDDAVKSVRQISRELLPVTLKEFGLANALNEFSNRFNKGILNISVKNEEAVKLEYKTELALYRVVQETFSNSLKHGDASEINVNLDIQPKNLKLNIDDNGRGFCLNEYKSTPVSVKGLGLRNIESRVGMLNGKVNYDSAKGRGCRIKIEVPLAS